MKQRMVWIPPSILFTQDTYELMVKDLLGINKVMVEALKDVAKGAPLNLSAWRHLKSRLMLGNGSAIYLKASPKL